MTGLEIKDALDPSLKPYAEAIGSLCHIWSVLEDAVDWLFDTVAGMPDGPVTAVMLRCIDFRDKIDALKVGIIAAKHNPRLIKAVLASLNHVDNELRNRRNRLVHDRWIPAFPDLPVARIPTTKPRVLMPQAKRYAVDSGRPVRESVEDIQEVIDVVRSQAQFLADAAAHIMQPEVFSLKALLGTPPLQLRPRPNPERFIIGQ